MLVRQFLRFTGVGAIGTAGHYTTLVTLVELLRVNAVPASLAGFTIGALINYHLNRSFTFESDLAHRVAMPKFFTIAATGAVFNTLIMALSVDHFGLHYFLAQILASAVVLVWGFLGNRLWTFSHPVKQQG